MTGMYDVANLRIWKHQTHDFLKFEEIYSTVQILRRYSSTGIAQIGLCMKRYYNSIFLKFKLSFRSLRFRVAWKSDSKFVKLDKSNSSNIVTIS